MAHFPVPSAVAEGGDAINLTASAVAMNGPGYLVGIWVSSASATPTIKVWDNTAGSGTVIANTFTPVGANFYRIPARLKTGCFVTISGTVDCTVFVKPI